MRARSAGRKVAGTLTIRYRLPVVNDTHATGGPQGSPRIDGSGRHGRGHKMEVGEPICAGTSDTASPYAGPKQYAYHHVTFRAGIQDIGDQLPSFPTRSYGSLVETQFFVGVHAKIF